LTYIAGHGILNSHLEFKGVGHGGHSKTERGQEMEDARVAAVRANSLIGRGTCSEVDECLSDQEVAKELDDFGITDPAQAVRHFIEMEDISMDRMMDCRWGEDSDPQVAIKASWDARKEEATREALIKWLGEYND